MSQSRSRCTGNKEVTSQVHPGRPCHPCILCNKGNQSKYFHPKSSKDASLLDRLKQFEPSLGIEPDSCICRPCYNESKDIKAGECVPRWRKLSKGMTQPCFVPGCMNSAQKVTKLANQATIQQFFSSTSISQSHTMVKDDDGVPLCTEHYGAWYRNSNPSHKHCKTCGKNLTDLSKSRPYPQPQVIQKFLQENTLICGEINPEDRACYTCYKSHLVTIRHINSTTQSTNPDLGMLLTKIKEEIQAISDISTIESAVSYTSKVAAIYVGEALLKNTALLLPEVNEFFCIKLKEILNKHKITEIAETITSAWLRSQLSSMLEPHMAYRCSVKSCGTVLYRFGGDIFHALNVALGQVRTHKSPTTSPEEEFQTKLSDTCLSLNAKCHACIKNMIEKDASCPQMIEDIDIESFIDNLDPDIWKAVCLLTQPITSKAKNSTNSLRKVRRTFCICVLFFTINSQCSFPMHTLITDAIETCGGSSRLQKILNRLGACACIDEHDRYIQYRVQKKMKEGPMFHYPQNSFLMVSADNLDYVHGYARVFSGKQQSSWHGTTVQVVQPKPLGLIDTPHSTQSSAQPSAQSSAKRLHSVLTPMNSPAKQSLVHSPIPKKQRRGRTGKEFKSVTDQVTTVTTTSHVTNLEKPNLKIQDFQLTSTNKEAIKKIREEFDHYMLLKLACTDNTETMIDLKSYLTLAQDIKAPECSNVIYYKVINQRCDDKETLLNVINDIYAEFIITGIKALVFLEGDQATYERLQSIKKEYSQDLCWMYPFPGDWHILKNFQEVLIKIYYDGGLCDLAKASGYQPKSIGSNFKRTHHFLMEVWESFYRYFMSIFLSKDNVPSDFLESTSNGISSLPPSPDQPSAQRNLNEMFTDLKEKFSYEDEFENYMNIQMTQDETFKFWGQFVLQDCYAYVSLYLAMRSGNWQLRIAAIKSMASLFAAFDRQKYQKLIYEKSTAFKPKVCHCRRLQ